jgi:hypothetical protein
MKKRPSAGSGQALPCRLCSGNRFFLIFSAFFIKKKGQEETLKQK